jgi:hypothetical protein
MDKHQNQNEQFLASLDEKDRIIHELAKTMLATRYDPARTNAFGKMEQLVASALTSASTVSVPSVASKQ